MRVAVVHHWFVTRGGGERVAECIANLFPTAEIFTLVGTDRGIPQTLRSRKLHTSFLQRVPFGTKYHRHLLPLYPLAVEALDLHGFDLILSSDSGPVKGVRADPSAVHICYCHSPMRYLWDGYQAYRAHMGPFTRTLFSATAGPVRKWDLRAAQKVTHFIANSAYVADRIRRVYGRESTVIHPPIDLCLARSVTQPSGHYLCAGRLVGYKRTDLWIQACQRLGRKLRIAGTGPEERRLRGMAGPNVSFLGDLPDNELWQQYAECRALLFAADEDFGMVPLEAQACGRPVVAYGAGGSLETVRATLRDPTGVYFQDQSVDSATQGILAFEAADASRAFQPQAIQAWADNFGTDIFARQLREFILGVLPEAASAMAPERSMVEQA